MLAYLTNIWRIRHFWLALVRNDLRSRYRRSLFGLGWSLLQPVATTIVLCAVFAQVFGVGYRDYAPFLLIGLTFWGFITTVINHGCQTFLVGESYIRQHRVPLAIYPLRTTLSAGYHFLIGLSVAAVLIWCLKGVGSLPALAGLVPALVLLMIFGWSLAVCTGVLNVLFHDTQHLLEILLQILFYMTPIIYPPSVLGGRNLGWAVQFNPLAVMIELIRPPLLEGRLPTPQIVGLSLLVTLATLGVAAAMLKWCERRLVFYL